MYLIRDFASGKEVTPTNLVFTGAKGPWDVEVDQDHIRSRINRDYFRKEPPYASKYLPFMPIRDYSNFISLQEGATPLLQSRRIGQMFGIDLWFKLEPHNPTGSFKDRGSAVDLTIAREMGAKAIVLASTGNMAASCACYAAAAKMPCFIFVPEGTPQSKLAQVISYGGRIVQVKGTYNDAARLAQQVAEELGFYLAGDYAFRVEGQKTAAYEVIDQLFYQVPDAVIVPIGCGTNMTAYGKGFNEYRQLGFIDRIPKLIGVQAAGASAVVNSFVSGRKDIAALPSINTIATAIAVTEPLDGIKALSAIYESGGSALAVNDSEMLEAQYLLSREEGLFVEVSCASAIAALSKLAQNDGLRGQRVVCVLTGGGLKDPQSILRVALKPPTIYPEVKEFMAMYRSSFFEGRTVAFFDRAEVVFAAAPTLEEVRQKSQHYFNARYSDAHLSNIVAVASRFLLKGKPITFADFQDIVQDALEMVDKPVGGAFKVEDFEIVTGKDVVPRAKVLVSLEGRRIEARATGVGPVDAVINALREACGSQFSFALVGYRVGIRSEGTDAVTTVEMKLSRENQNSVGTGASPDIIQASIEAFEEAYNGLNART